MVATTAPTSPAIRGQGNGRYIWSDSQEIQVYDATVLSAREFDFSLNTALGASINMSKVNPLTMTKASFPYKPNVLPSPRSDGLKAAVNQRPDTNARSNPAFTPCSGLERTTIFGHYRIAITGHPH